ncbi:MAG: AraC family transcriptional regulator [Chloroflexi bacterium]|nr:MAG: AraC family transcriptional regulator [Chloroflexota bacterium]MBL1194381.1 AraC family transcriptional regulator [Chloroflexota bacterium]NOH11669.1 helix-turn-helix transcriptional regulator [Chloroflexota bacterium]
MLILRSAAPIPEKRDYPVSPLNAVWYGSLRQRVTLPQLGHLFLVFPLGEARISCAGTILEHNQYLFLTQPSDERPYTISNLHSTETSPQLLVLFLSPDFIVDMAGFLGIPADLNQLLHAVPLLQGDTVSQFLQGLIATEDMTHAAAEEPFMDIIGQVLHLQRLRHQALLNLSSYKRNTISELLPRLLQARQYIEARYLHPIKTKQVAGHVALSEYHFARLFKTTFDVTVRQYVIRLRLDEARRLLESTDKRVTDIGLEVGYTSLSAFINAFRRQVGISPSGYRSQFQALAQN